MARKHAVQIFAVLIGLALPLAASQARADRVRRLVTLAGAPDNQIVGYGLVVGLPGTGDQTTQIPYTQQAITNMLSHEGITLPKTAFMQPNDVASVMVTAQVPPYTEPGSNLTVTVAALGNATSLSGGVLLPTPLKGSNGHVYAQAQGPLLVSGFAAAKSGSSVRRNTPTVGRIPDGAVMSRAIPTATWSHYGSARLLLKRPSYENATRIATAIDRALGRGVARATSPDVVEVRRHGRLGAVAFMARVLGVQVTPEAPPPAVIVDAQSGTIVMGGDVRLRPAIVSYGNLTVSIQAANSVSQPNPLARGNTVGVQNANITARQSAGHVVTLPAATTLAQIAAALNKIGAKPSDLIAIVEALKEAGALDARVKVV
ncbi:flagellar P-ring protein [Defluviimonas sp. 20V17]|uniref:Flagellar P-ring protein n=1 Tax=Allgaiera indica TaxID=765699 RepID=A0AAN4UN12_9RHOB|nr:flagellar basal body P-ring protein FlgI [Allgaiera indica]KDB03490.1 flagellar P-ring protein [Defluviimonas sp. 20V17]GHD98114.1 flagellar P-ring protein [Allgaiera indica]SDW53601.1 flagellar P-ring protein precursor FlgI [Allgaiera indica]